MKKIIIIAAVLLVVGAGAGFFIKQLANPPYKLAAVQKGDITQEVFASGKIEAPTSIDLHFKTSGKMIVLKAKVGKKIEAGQVLAKQETGTLDAALAAMQAGIDVEKAKLAQQQAGASPENVAVAETAVANAQQAVIDARQNFVDKLQEAYTQADDAVRNKADQMFVNPLSTNPKLTFSVVDSNLQNDIEWSRSLIESTVFRIWKPYVYQLTVDSNLSEYASTTRKYLGDITLFLDKLAGAVNNPNDTYTVNGATVAVPSNWKVDVSTAKTSLNAVVAGISAVEEKLDTSESALKTAQDQLTLVKIPLRPTDTAVFEAQIRQAEAQAQQVQAQIRDMEIIAPISGIITATNGNIGEIIDPSTVVVSMISADALQVKVNLSEDNVVGVKVGQTARVTADALPNEWQGTVTAIDPAGTVIDGSVYYKTTITFNEPNDQVKAGMTSDVWIKTGSASSTLIVPASAIQKNGSDTFVQIYENGKTTDQNVTTGLRGNGTVEVVSGVSEGDQVVIGGK